MPIVVNTNVSSMNAQRYLGVNTAMLAKSQEKLASGYRINRASDDAAGLQLSESLRTQIRGSQKAYANTQDAVNVLNIVDGAYSTIGDSLQRMRELTVQASNDTYDASQRSAIKSELDQLMADVDRIAGATQFNGVKLMDGSQTNFNVQLGANGTAGTDSINLGTAVAGTNPFANAAAAQLNASLTPAALLVTTSANAQTAIGTLDAAIATVSARRGAIGALTNRLDSAASNLQIGIENLSASESRIRNVDVASESAKMTQAQILQSASATILSQANQSPSLALQLLKGGG
jgi:flagellin